MRSTVRLPAFWLVVVLFTLALALLLADPSAADDVKTSSATNGIILENNTYSPLHYRVRSPGGSYTSWRKVLPGAAVQYDGYAALDGEIYFDKDRTESYRLANNELATLTREAPRGPLAFVRSSERSSALPELPGAPQDDNSDPFQPLERFIDRCEKTNTIYRLSLKQLAIDCMLAQKDGELPDELRFVRGFTWFFGALIDKENDDIILLGVKDITRPPIDIDCIATAIKSVWSKSTPLCSLDEHSDPKLQKTRIEGVPWNTRWALVMIYADYIMKTLVHSDTTIPGVRSYWDIGLTRYMQNPTTQQQGPGGRLWFNFNSEIKRAVSDDSGTLLVLYRNPVRVSAEKKVDGKFGSGQVDPDMKELADGVTSHIDTIGKHYEMIGELLALYRLLDLLEHCRSVGNANPPRFAYWQNDYKHPYAGPPETFPTMQSRYHEFEWNRNRTRYWFRQTGGGVLMQLDVTPESLQRTSASRDLMKRIRHN